MSTYLCGTPRSDFVYMVPPFLAYYGVLNKNQTMLQLAYDQCRLYRQALVDDDAGGMWRHITGNTTDSGHWTTGKRIRARIHPPLSLAY